MASLTTADPAATFPVSPTSATALLKTDAHGRAAILAEFEHSGLSAAQFAQLAGIKYSTFAQWVQKHRRQASGAPALWSWAGS